jgi:glycosyltransferase involved in cell wall biosynthesis
MIASIILCTRNRCQALSETLKSLNKVSVPAGMQVEALVMDNGSTDDTAAVTKDSVLDQIKLRYIHEPKAGKANALNTGLKQARGEILLFSDDDVRFDPAWLKEISEPVAAGRNDALTGAVRIAPHLRRPWMTSTHQAWLASTDYLSETSPEAAVGANMSFHRRVLEKVPGYDTALGPGQLGLYEDTLFSMQLMRAGFRLGKSNTAIVEHHFDPARLTRKSFLSHANAQGRSQAYVLWHWNHEDRGALGLRIARREVELRIKRLLHRRECLQPEGIPVWEMELVTAIAFMRQFQVCRKQPRAYEKFGLRKLQTPS